MEQKAKEAASHAAIPVSISAMLVTLGVVYLSLIHISEPTRRS